MSQGKHMLYYHLRNCYAIYKQIPMCLVVESFPLSPLTFGQAEEIQCLNL